VQRYIWLIIEMSLKDKLPVSYMLFIKRGRMGRLTYWTVSLFIWTSFYVLFNFLEAAASYRATIVLYPVLFWALICTATKRLHDGNRSGHFLWLLLIPVFGPVMLFYLMGFKKGNGCSNRYGMAPGAAADYFTNGDAGVIPHLKTGERIVNDVTQLNPIVVSRAETPASIGALQDIIRNAELPISIGGGRFSMGGQTASPNSIHIDMRKLNRIVDFSPEARTIKVEAGIRWCDIQQAIDPHNLSVMIMQTYANFTVGGALSVNCHGRYVGAGPVILSVQSLEVILEDGSLVSTSPQDKPELFFATIGCYNAVAIIATAELKLEENVPVKRVQQKMGRGTYKDYFFSEIRNTKDIVFHNGDVYPPAYRNMRAVSWEKTSAKPTVKTRLMPIAAAYPVERYFLRAFSRSRFGKWRRERIIDPILYARTKVHWRNYEAGYDVAELEPKSRADSTYVLQEYFVPVAAFDAFGVLMEEIFTRHNVNVLNVSIRHALPDTGSMLAWARKEVFAFVVYYKQNTSDWEKGKVAVWTRELIDAAISLNGAYYLPYQAHATQQQFHMAYPNAAKLFALKDKLDPHFKFRNVIWDTYYKTGKEDHE
jgi:FAD/FMN-containing dehydrogenase/uncharacterized membrane protein YhaH (DUF805 family)